MISIIVPTYNDEKNIIECLDSILSQSYKNFEVIVVIDGSTDKTLDIVNSYINKIPNLKIIQQNNSGSGVARNNGLSKAMGEYIMFVDADDILFHDSLQIMIDSLVDKDIDLLIGSSVIFEDINGKKYNYDNIFSNKFITDSHCIQKECINMFIDGRGHGPWAKLYKKDIITKYKVKFPDLRRSQDIIFNNIYYRYIRNLKIIDDPVYKYRNIYSNINKIKKDAKDRKNYSIFVQNEIDYYETIKIVHDSIFNTIKFWGINLDSHQQRELNRKFFIDVFDSIYILSFRKRSGIIETISKISGDNITLKYINNYKFNLSYLSLFVYFLKIKNYHGVSLVIKLKVFLYINFADLVRILKAIFRKYKKRG